ncbi:DUF397 domain-containing protein [Streptomyces sp. NPDC001848]|uniref:DUF397 domain-containing protein n=1 Tax=Streptomyces sp. NPDC001848 TaxID=3364618 RepID=UPI0036A4C105
MHVRSKAVTNPSHWRKSSYSNGSGDDCVKVADGLPGVVPVRDSMGPQEEGPVLLFRPSVRAAFLSSSKR